MISDSPASVAHTVPPTGQTDTEAMIDMVSLRAYRLRRVRAQLRAHDYAACLLLDPINIRYATGSRNYTMFQMHTPSRYLFVPAEGPVTLFDAEVVRSEERRVGKEC